MRNIIKSTIFSLALTFTPNFAKADEKILTLNKDNHISLSGEINEKSSNEFIYKLLTYNRDNLIVHINSPGGSVVDGMKIIQIANDLKVKNKKFKITCYVDFAASMAFAITQGICDDRFIGITSTLMQHQATFGIRGREGEVSSRLNMILSLLEISDKMQADRLELSVTDFRRKSRDEWWLIGKKGIDNKAADSIAPVVCTKELTSETRKENIKYFATPVELTWSLCPLITYPTNINISDQNLSKEQKDKLEKEIRESLEIKKDKFTVSP